MSNRAYGNGIANTCANGNVKLLCFRPYDNFVRPCITFRINGIWAAGNGALCNGFRQAEAGDFFLIGVSRKDVVC